VLGAGERLCLPQASPERGVFPRVPGIRPLPLQAPKLGALLPRRTLGASVNCSVAAGSLTLSGAATVRDSWQTRGVGDFPFLGESSRFWYRRRCRRGDSGARGRVRRPGAGSRPNRPPRISLGVPQRSRAAGASPRQAPLRTPHKHAFQPILLPDTPCSTPAQAKCSNQPQRSRIPVPTSRRDAATGGSCGRSQNYPGSHKPLRALSESPPCPARPCATWQRCPNPAASKKPSHIFFFAPTMFL